NGGGNHPQASNKRTEQAVAAGSGDFATHNGECPEISPDFAFSASFVRARVLGRASGTVSAAAPSFPALICPTGQVVVNCPIMYSDITMTIYSSSATDAARLAGSVDACPSAVPCRGVCVSSFLPPSLDLTLSRFFRRLLRAPL